MEQIQTLNVPEVNNTGLLEPDSVATHGVTRVLIGGFDNAGKSTLACSLYKALEQDGTPTALYELDRWSDTHAPILGHKSWDQRKKVAEVTVDEYAAFAQNFKTDSSNLVLGDIEGRYQNPHSRTLKDSADFAILVARPPIDKDKTTKFLQTEAGWEGLFEELNVPIALRVYSVRNGDKPPKNYLPIRDLNRELCPANPGIKKLAKKVVELAKVRSW